MLTSGSHAPIAIAAAEAGLHVLAEKPVCYSVAEGLAMLAAAERAGTVLMVGYPKRYDPAFRGLPGRRPRADRDPAAAGDHARVAVPALRRALPAAPPPAAAAPSWPDGCAPSTTRASPRPSAADATEFERRIYQPVLLDTMVHEFNTVRGLLGEPDRLDYVDVRDDSVTAMSALRQRPGRHPLDRPPGIARYQMESRCSRRTAG